MNNQSMDEVGPVQHSTYGLVTAQRIFDLLGIYLTDADLQNISDNSHSPYYQLLQVPLKNIFNGIIIDQATDYREYAQKMLVDYLLSGAANLSEEQTKPEGVRLELEMMRTDLIERGDQFDLVQFEHFKLINESQGTLMDISAALPSPIELIDEPNSLSVKEAMSTFSDHADQIGLQVKTYRKQFYDTILRARELLDTVPEYFNQFEADPTHKESLHFDANLGEKIQKA